MKKLIVNADDFGYAKGINEGIIKAFREGILTSTSIMVKAPACSHAISLFKENPDLGLGLHFQVDNYDKKYFWETLKNPSKDFIEQAKKEFLKQIDIFKKLTGRLPDHIDGHYHVHRVPGVFDFIKSWCEKSKIPYRDKINFIDSFFGVPKIENISVNHLLKILKNLPEGQSELMCHPGIVSPDLNSSYSKQREVELKTLTSPIIKKAVKKLKIKLIKWSEIKIP